MTEEEFVQAVERVYPREFACAKEISRVLQQRCGAALPQAEMAFLAASLHRTCRAI